MIFIIAKLGQLEWANQTTLHPVGVVTVVVLGLIMLFVPRKYAVIPMLIMACFVAQAQRIVVMGLDFNLLRVLVIFGWIRVFTRSEMTSFTWKALDVVTLLWAFSSTISYTLLHASTAAFINRLGFMFDAVGMYFLFRILVRDWNDLLAIIRALAIISVPVAMAFLIERSTGRNMFSIFGGVPEITVIRQGKLRCQGAFSHPILAGCFWASLLPMIAASYSSSVKWRMCSIVSLGACSLIIFACASSTPMMAVAVACIGAAMWFLRHWMRWICAGVLIVLVGLHLIMNAPVWHLISRIDLVGGSTGWHRYYLIDQAINRVGEWWLLGTTSTAHWGWGLADVTNQYVLESVRGGIATLTLFVLSLVIAFSNVGRIWRSMQNDHAKMVLGWSLGVALFVHTIVFLAVSYFGQIYVIWFLLLAIIGSLTPTRKTRIASTALSTPLSRTRHSFANPPCVGISRSHS
ncbi:MAG: hypothetical protein IH984_05180 [Planctomycetes bacterium]|nr:hypothetical protein [Planctomycetota bacterium]